MGILICAWDEQGIRDIRHLTWPTCCSSSFEPIQEPLFFLPTPSCLFVVAKSAKANLVFALQTSRSGSVPGSTNSSVKNVSRVKKRNLSSASEGDYTNEDNYAQNYGHGQRPVKRTRNLGNEQMKLETSLTRITGACVACQRKKIRVSRLKDGTDPCINCTSVWSRKRQDCTIYQMPCIRAKITATTLFRLGPTEDYLWTKRWVGSTIQEIPNWAKPVKYHIQITQDRAPPLELIVQEYIPAEGDRQHYEWKRPDGTRGRYETGPYAVVNIEQTKKAFENYIDENMGCYLESCLEGSRPIVVTTFATALNSIDFPKSQLIKDCLRLFVAARFIEDSWRMCGPETLNCQPELDPTSPYFDRIPVTPILDFQIDAICINLILKPLRSKVLNMLQNKILTTKPDQDWMEIKIATFILLTNIEWTVRHDNYFARLHSMQTRFSNRQFIEDAFNSGRNLLWHFRAVAGGGVPFFLDYKEGETKPAREGSGLGDQVKYVQKIKQLVHEEHRLARLRTENNYEAEMYWTSQMLQPDWQPVDTPPPDLHISTGPKPERVKAEPVVLPVVTTKVKTEARVLACGA
ncbi:hypothetical protein BJ508DRAFT_211060 [Ascobolus immersus RN42]|uniref:Zn(2)-C6 fungal-type domain-containing protein n=1 Tax=Ascobolus immersus RN42 TaxID=1160509 RepID=A0A3N4I2E6_ASCIM|nr:hypothetical protein BJ508DRAFT_211060 [Ascobolus immersus RN42]